MKVEFRPFDESTLVNAREVVERTFSAKALPLLDKILLNPLRKEFGNGSAGDIAYQDGKPVAFQAAIVRRLYLGRKPIIGVVGSTLGALPETSPVMLIHLMKRTIAKRNGSVLFFANTANLTSMKMNRLLGISGKGPISCERIRFACVVSLPILRNLLQRPSAIRLMKIEEDVFDDFWSRYLERNKGLVVSRSAKELEWMFGENIRKGSDILLAEFNGSALIGYIVIRETRGMRRWMVVDILALNDDHSVVLSLLKSAVRFLRRERRAIVLECIGFPCNLTAVVRRVLPFARKTRNNSFIWGGCATPLEIPDNSWFYGPYDGDRCL